MKRYYGEVLSEGVAVGKIFELANDNTFGKTLSVKKEKDLLLKALQLSIQQIEEMKHSHQKDTEYLDMQKMLLEDKTLIESAYELIHKGYSAAASIIEVFNAYSKKLMNCDNAYLQQRAYDLFDIKDRILDNLHGKKEEQLKDPFILLAQNIRPSFIIQNQQHLLGVITKRGGYSSHGAILCRQLNIPYMIADIDKMDGKIVIIDTRFRQIIVEPIEPYLNNYQAIIRDLSQEEFSAIEHGDYGFYANVSDNQELERVLKYGFDGIGLYRTEMIFMNLNRPYTLEEQYEIYHHAVLKMNGKPICFRTFDIGDDKKLPYLETSEKGVDNYLKNTMLFENQIKALLMANEFNNMKIMFPMVATPGQYYLLRNWVLKIKNAIAANSVIKIGMMLETKEALEHISDFEHVDFISIGTNDLIMSIYHISRDLQKQKIKKYFDDLILKLKPVVDYCHQHQIELSVCGELASIDPALKAFMKIGIKNFSVAAPAIKTLNKIYKELN